jgi:hypothetical protein
MTKDANDTPEAFEAAGKPHIAQAIREGLAKGRITPDGSIAQVEILHPFTEDELREALTQRNRKLGAGDAK